MKKALIWIGCFLLATIINMLLSPLGLRLGYGLTYIINVWLAIYLCKKFDKNTMLKQVQTEAFYKDMTLKQYIPTVVPPQLISFCESNKDDPDFLKKNLKYIPLVKTIPKRYLIALLELYK